MFITEYLTGLSKTIEQYAGTDLIISSEIKVDARTEKMGFVKGSLTFLDESRLYFTEYLDLRYKVDKLSYVFHYQDQTNRLIFRYDNATHKPKILSQDHKHTQAGVELSAVPDLGLVLEEIIQQLV